MNFYENSEGLRKIMVSQGLEWIIHHVDDEIRNGKTIIEKKGKTIKLVKRVDYDSKEKYILLLEAYKRGFLEPLNIVADIKRKHLSKIQSIKFVDEYSQENTLIISKPDEENDESLKDVDSRKLTKKFDEEMEIVKAATPTRSRRRKP